MSIKLSGWLERNDGKRLPVFQYCCVGLVTALLYFSLYYLIRNTFSFAPWMASATAFFPAIVFQYAGHSKFTYNRPLKDTAQFLRFVIVVVSGLTISTIVTGIIWPALALPELFSLIVVLVLLPIVNFIIFTIWVFISPGKSKA